MQSYTEELKTMSTDKLHLETYKLTYRLARLWEQFKKDHVNNDKDHNFSKFQEDYGNICDTIIEIFSYFDLLAKRDEDDLTPLFFERFLILVADISLVQNKNLGFCERNINEEKSN